MGKCLHILIIYCSYDPSNPKDAEELLNILDELEDDTPVAEQIKKSSEIQFILHPPNDGADSDQDDAGSDEECISNIRDIGKGVLREPMDIVLIQDGEVVDITESVIADNDLAPDLMRSNSTEDSSDPEDNVPLAKRFRHELYKKTKGTRIWQQLDLTQEIERHKILKNDSPDFCKQITERELKPVDLFKMLFDEEFVQLICDESRKYATFKGVHSFSVSTREMYIYLGILLLSGYTKVPNRRNYWETRADSYNCLVSNSISRNRFEMIHRFLHFNDNSKMDKDNKVYKVQTLIDRVNKVSQDLFQPKGKNFSLDEAMEPYYGPHSMKQFIRGKPIRYGFKFWCLTTTDGYLLKFSPYCGAGDKKDGISLGTSVTENLCLGFIPPKSTIYLDNFFNSLPLLNSLKIYDINCIGTIREDRVEKAPLQNLKKCDRGSFHVLKDKNSAVTLVRWNDNSQVTIATNVEEANISLSKGSCRRWSRKEKSVVSVAQPTVINMYNQGMGGVDLFDKMRGLYRTRIRSKKWYWPFVRFCLNGGTVNLWILYRYCHPKVSLLEFIRDIVLALLTSPEYLAGPKPKCSRSVLTEVRFDKTDHLIDNQETQRRCANCGKCTKFHCVKCNVGLHPATCFRNYHTPSQ